MLRTAAMLNSVSGRAVNVFLQELHLRSFKQKKRDSGVCSQCEGLALLISLLSIGQKHFIKLTTDL